MSTHTNPGALDDEIASLEHHDLAGTCGHPDRYVCDCCWVRRRNKQVAAEEPSTGTP